MAARLLYRKKIWILAHSGKTFRLGFRATSIIFALMCQRYVSNKHLQEEFGMHGRWRQPSDVPTYISRMRFVLRGSGWKIQHTPRLGYSLEKERE